MDYEQNEETDPFNAVPNFANKTVVATFTNDQLTDFNKVFNKLDKSGSSYLEIVDLGPLLRGIGMNPSNKLVNDILTWFQEKSNLKYLNAEKPVTF